MRIALLTRSSQSYSIRRLKEAAHQRGHKAVALDTLKFSIDLEHHSPELYYGRRRIGHYDAVIPRIGASITFYGLAVLRQFEQMGVYCANESIALSRSRDKLRSIQILSKYDVGIPATAFVREKGDVLPAIRRLGGAPVVIKVLEGTQGVGVILADTEKVAEAIIETLQSARQNVLIQKFVQESRGRDIRAIVVGDHVVAAMRRTAIGDEFRSNVHRGGRTEAVTLGPEFERTAIRAAQIMGLRIAGVDMLEADNGPQVMEVNSSPGLEGIERTTGIDVAGAMIEDVENRVLFPDLDLHYRMRLAAGFGVAEFTVHKMPRLENKALRETHLAEENIHVLSITRHEAVIANPRGDEVIHPGDVLLCYGQTSSLRALMPGRRPRRKKAKKGASPRHARTKE